jgi:glucosylceramidase
MLTFLLTIVTLISCYSVVTYTSKRDGPWLEKGSTIEFGNVDGNAFIELQPNDQLQEIFGIGSALTEAAASNFVGLSQANQDNLAKLYFDPVDGIGTTMTRTHINSPDFAISEYIYTTNDDPDLGTFNIDRERRYVLPLVKAALKINPNLQIFSSPWSPPGWMKDNGRMTNGGKLKKENYGVWAKYMARYVTEFEKEGVKIFMLTVQNEPAASQSWESCIYSGQEEGDFAVNYLKPALSNAGRPDVKVYIWDHNKGMCLERAEQSYGVSGGLENIDGLAFHWYGGDHFEDINDVHTRWPNKPMISSEICRGDIFGSESIYFLFLMVFILVSIVVNRFFCL